MADSLPKTDPAAQPTAEAPFRATFQRTFVPFPDPASKAIAERRLDLAAEEQNKTVRALMVTIVVAGVLLMFKVGKKR